MEHRSLFYKAYIQPHINFCNIVRGNSSNYNVSQITKLQRRVCKIILGTEYSDLDSARRRLDILSFEQNVLVNKAKIMYKVVHDMVPQYIKYLFQLRADTVPDTSLRSASNQNSYIPKPNISLFKNSLSYYEPVIWNTIPSDIKKSSSIYTFTRNRCRMDYKRITHFMN